MIGGVTWILEVEVVGQSDGGRDTQHLELKVSNVLDQAERYYFAGERFDAVPALEAGSTIQVRVSRPSTTSHESVRFVAVQAAGTPNDIAEGAREFDGQRALSVILAFDDAWILVNAPDRQLDTYREVLDLYPRDQNGVISLVKDARQRLWTDNEWALARVADPEGGESVGAYEDLAPTNGALGEWRRSRGFEGSLAEVDQSARLAEWAARSPEERQLPTNASELIEGDAAAIGLETWAERRIVLLEFDAGLIQRFPWLGIYYPGFGVIGPFGIQAVEVGWPTLHGYGPPGTDALLVGWEGNDIPDLRTAVILGTIPSTDWDEEGTIWGRLAEIGRETWGIERLDPPPGTSRN